MMPDLTADYSESPVVFFKGRSDYKGVPGVQCKYQAVQQIVRAYEQAAEARTPKNEKRAVSDDKR